MIEKKDLTVFFVTIFLIPILSLMCFPRVTRAAYPEGPVTIPVVGDDRAANAIVATLAREIGLEAIDVGPLRHARIVEGLHYLRANAYGGRINYHLPRDTSRD